MQFSGKVAAVTGAASAIGRAPSLLMGSVVLTDGEFAAG